MNYLSAENIARNVGERYLFQNLTFGILQGEKVALIGSNGSGKTSLLDIIAGKTPPDGGIVSIRKDIRVGYLDQDPDFDKSKTVLETIFASENAITKAIKDYEEALMTDNHDLLARSMEQIDDLNAWDYDVKVKQILGRLGITDFDKTMRTLSGGQQKRVALARVLIDDPDFLILDEPTNHLDLDTIEWLEGYLASANTTLFLVTHDRYFLDTVCNNIMELSNGNIYKYKGNYAYFLEKKAEREVSEAASVDKAKNLLRKELDWMRRQPKARTHKAQYRVDAFYETKEKASQAVVEEKLQLNMKMTRLGSKIIEINHISKSFGDKKIVSEFSYTFKKGDKIGIVGKNGLGKTSLLAIITQQLKPDMGSIVKGDTIEIGYYSQGGLDFRDDQRVIDVVQEIAEYIQLAKGQKLTASAFLTLFLFPPAVQYNFVSKLSGGEKRRLQLLKVLIKNPNFLILDEPTNDLDIATLNVLEDFLQSYEGCLLIVSHDRYFMDRLVDHIFAFEGDGKIKDFPGNYTDYREWKEENSQELGIRNQELDISKNSKTESLILNSDSLTKRKLSFKEQKEYETLEKEIAELEVKKDQIIEKMNAGGNHSELTVWAREIEEIGNLVDEKSLRWLELAEFI